MGQTPISSGTPYLTVTQFLEYKDVRAVAQLSVDDGSQPTAAQLATNLNLAQILASASGEIESALLASERYATVDLSVPNGNSQAYLQLLCAKLAMYELYQRRDAPNPPETVLAGYEEAQEHLKMLGNGERILSFAESASAGVTEDEFLNLSDLARLDRFTDQCRRNFAIQADERRAARPY